MKRNYVPKNWILSNRQAEVAQPHIEQGCFPEPYWHISIHARQNNETQLIISDHDDKYFEVIGHNMYISYLSDLFCETGPLSRKDIQVILREYTTGGLVKWV